MRQAFWWTFVVSNFFTGCVAAALAYKAGRRAFADLVAQHVERGTDWKGAVLYEIDRTEGRPPR